MSIHGISGKPGGGKSLYAMRMVIDELLHGNRPIITNLAIKLPELNEYLQREHPNKVIDLFARVRLLDDSETGRFWTVRPRLQTPISVLTKDEWEKKNRPDYSGVTDSGVFYVIDEVHNFFNARAWMETGRDVLFYLSQHRKLGDTVIWVTQHINNVDKQFRSVTQDYTYIRNLNKEKHGMFTMPAMFVRNTYGEPATNNSTPMEMGTFKMDVKGIASCYDTAKGVSIHGNMGDKGEKKKGIPWYWLIVALIAISILVFYGIPKFLGKILSPKLPKHEQSQLPQQNRPNTNPIQNTNQLLPVVTIPKTSNIKWTGYDTLTGKFRVMLSNGQFYRAGDGHLTELGIGYVIIDGIKYEK